ncbi:hypothetical protein CYLTODRAFT_399821 [Cylindrobasidium torrendii FP15055 ss-10]|uniref:RlpA-like protein double-psi beta-barrel domain-containing protein n=1 Tax=Cylindrobasidium torrendii FP15055 ss-10 TaxID=1314674 RepID=A0A0D7B6H8_9AGAR|nr:hypothetical protein CYLTODRAFT_399821 [Cylindrobasidium torrendii FP15055 ss-10]
MFRQLVAVLTIFTLAILSVVASPVEKRAFTGDGTYYAPGLGACGKWNTDKDMIVAVSHLLYDTYPGHTANPNNNPICGKKLRAHYKGRSVVVTVADECMGCNGKYDLDFSPAAIKKLVNNPATVGRLHGVTWEWI